MNPYYIIYALFFHTCIYHTSLYTDYRSTGWIFYLFILGKDAVSGSSLARSVKISSSEATCYRLDGPFAENDGKGWTSWVGARHMSSCVLPEFSFTQRLFLKFSQLDLIMPYKGCLCLLNCEANCRPQLFWKTLTGDLWMAIPNPPTGSQTSYQAQQVFKWSTLAVSLNASLVRSNLLPDEWLVAFLCK